MHIIKGVHMHRLQCLGTGQLELGPIHYWFMKEKSVRCHQHGCLVRYKNVQMNRLAVYSYLTRYLSGHTGFGIMSTVLLSERS